MSGKAQILVLGATEVIRQNIAVDAAVQLQPTYQVLDNYDHLFGPAGTDSLPRMGDLNDTLTVIRGVIRKYNWQTAKIAKHLKADTLEQSCFNIWHFCINNIMYKNDRYGYEEIRTPWRSWLDRGTGIDCDCFTVLTCSILLQMGYTPKAAVVAFNGAEEYGHIYTVIGSELNNIGSYNSDDHNGGAILGGVVLDPVMNKIFNKHPKGITKAMIMNIQVLNGLSGLSGIITQKLELVDTYRDTFGQHNSGIDMTLTLGYAPNVRPAYGSVSKGNVVLIKSIGSAPNPEVPSNPGSDIRGYYVVEAVWKDSANNTGALYLITGKSVVDLKNDPKFKGAELEILDTTTDQRKSITGWNKGVEYARGKMAEAAGKIENCRRVYSWIKNSIAPDISLIKEQQYVSDFQNIVKDLESWKWYAEAAYNQCTGLLNTKNPYFGYQGGNTTDSGKNFLQNISDVYKMAAERMLAAESDFLSKEKKIQDWMKVTAFEKLQNAAKKVALAPVRGIIEGVIRINGFGIATSMLLAKERKPNDYTSWRNNWIKMGGDPSNFDAAVIAGAKKKALLKGLALGETETRYVQLPVGVGTTAATAIVAATGGTAAPYAAPAAVVIDGLVVAINAAKIPLKDKENQVTDPTAEFDFDSALFESKDDEEGGSGSSGLLIAALAVGAITFAFSQNK